MLEQQQQQQQYQQEPAAHRLNAIVLGDSHVGKTSLVYGLMGQDYKKARMIRTKTLVCQSFTVPTAFSVEGAPEVKSVVLWNMPGDAAYDDRRRAFHVPVDVVLLCFAKDSPASFASVQGRWMAEVREHMSEVCGAAPLVLVETKSDVSGRGCVATKDAVALARALGAVSYIECSSQAMFCVRSLFHEVVVAGACYRASLPRVPPIGTPPSDRIATEAPKAVPVKGVAPLLAVVGDPACGKSSIIGEFFGCDFSEAYTPTTVPLTMLLTPNTGVNVNVNANATLTAAQLQGKENVFVVDMPAGCSGDDMKRLTTAHSNVVFVICVPIFSARAAEAAARRWLRAASGAAPASRALLVGTKLDMYTAAAAAATVAAANNNNNNNNNDDDKEVSFFLPEDGKRLAKELDMASYSECSALTLFGVPNLRDYCTKIALSGRTLTQSMRGAMSFASSFWSKISSDDTPRPSKNTHAEGNSSGSGSASKSQPLEAGARSWEVNVVLVGAPGVGKTSVVERYTKKMFREEYTATVGASCYQKRIGYDADTTINLQLWDFPGEAPLARLPVDVASVVVLCVFDVTDPVRTLEYAAKTLDQIDALYGADARVPRELAANKVDLGWAKDAESLADEFVRAHSLGKQQWVRMSARTGQQIAAAVSAMIKMAVKRMSNAEEELARESAQAATAAAAALSLGGVRTIAGGHGGDGEEVIVIAENPCVVDVYKGEVKDENVFNESECPYTSILEDSKKEYVYLFNKL